MQFTRTHSFSMLISLIPNCKKFSIIDLGCEFESGFVTGAWCGLSISGQTLYGRESSVESWLVTKFTITMPSISSGTPQRRMLFLLDLFSK